MKLLIWGMRFLIPLVVLYTIGYYVAGFSALTFFWILLLSALIILGEWLIEKTVGRSANRLGKGFINFFLAAVIIFTVTLAIEGGNVPFGGALLAAAIIAILTALVGRENLNVR